MIHRKLFLPLACALAVGLVACAEEREEADEMIEAIQQEIEEPEVGPPGGPVEASLDPVGESGIGGEARLTALDGRIDVELTLDGASEGERYVAHLHQGECGNDLGMVSTIGEATPGAGVGSLRGTIDASSLNAHDSYFVQAHRAADNTAVACANVDLSGLAGSEVGAKTGQPGETY
jgi:hypothetical protein